MSEDTLQYQGVFCGEDYVTKGLFKMVANGLGWKSAQQSVVISSADLTSSQWLQSSPSACVLKIGAKTGAEFKFTGFRPSDKSAIESFLHDRYKISLDSSREISSKGSNWADVDLNEGSSCLTFKVDGRLAFEVPFAQVSQCAQAAASKTEVTVSFRSPDEDGDFGSSSRGAGGRSGALQPHQLVEMRFLVPGGASDASSAAKLFQKRIVSKAELGTAIGTGVATLVGVPILTPRGRYDMEIFERFIKLHGSSFDYRIPYESVVKLTELEKPGDVHFRFFVVSLDPPIRQGQSKYAHLVLHLDYSKDDVVVKLNQERVKWPALSGKEDVRGTQCSVVSEMFSVITGRKVTHTGTFTSSGGDKAVRCAVKASDGFLYPLEQALMFVHKPPIYLRFEDISSVEFSRLGESGASVSRSFDANVTMGGGSVHQFTGIPRQEFTNLRDFLVKKGIVVTADGNDGVEAEKLDNSAIGDTPAATAKSSRRAEAALAVAAAAKAAGDEDDEEEEDDDFVPGAKKDEEEDDSGNETPPEEYDENYLSDDDDPKKAPPSDDDDDLMHPAKKSGKKAAKDGEAEAEGDEKKKHKRKHKKHHKEGEGKDKEGKRKHKHKHHHHKHKHGEKGEGESEDEDGAKEPKKKKSKKDKGEEKGKAPEDKPKEGAAQ